jgi:hypothetical protein
MMLKYTMINLLLIALLIVPNLVLATGGDDASSVNSYLRSGGNSTLGLKSFGFLDPTRMNFQTSYSMSYATGGGQGLMQGLFMETIGYRLSNPVSLTFNLGMQHTPYSSFGPDGITKSARFVGGAALDWRPTQNMFLHLEIASYPSYGAYQYSPYSNPFPYYSPFPSQNNSGNQAQPNSESQSK